MPKSKCIKIHKWAVGLISNNQNQFSERANTYTQTRMPNYCTFSLNICNLLFVSIVPVWRLSVFVGAAFGNSLHIYRRLWSVIWFDLNYNGFTSVILCVRNFTGICTWVSNYSYMHSIPMYCHAYSITYICFLYAYVCVCVWALYLRLLKCLFHV